MIKPELRQEYFDALLQKKTEYEGIFYVGVKNHRGFLPSDMSCSKAKV